MKHDTDFMPPRPLHNAPALKQRRSWPLILAVGGTLITLTSMQTGCLMGEPVAPRSQWQQTQPASSPRPQDASAHEGLPAPSVPRK